MKIKNRHFVFKTLVCLVILASIGGLYLPASWAAEINLIPNPSLEDPDVSDPTMPDQWLIGGYGDNDRLLTYPVSGFDGLVAAKVEINSYVDGDAKWYFADVAVSPDTEYYFEDYYVSDVPTNIIVRYADVASNFSYQHLATVPAVLDWTQAIASFTPPEGTVSATIFHTLSQIGTLTVDAYGLFVQDPPTVTDFVPNHSMEESVVSNPDLPLAWHQGGYGNNTADFEYSDDAYDGSKSLKLTVADYIDGDAKWIYSSQAMPAGDYHFSAWYKTNTIPQVVAMFTRADASIYYFHMPNPQPQGVDWQEYASEFVVPSDVVAVTVFFFLTNNGWLLVDNFHITPYTYTGFDQAIVSLTFDDGAEENISTVLPVLDSYNFKSTHCYLTQALEGLPANIANVQALADSGHEICSHTVTHPFLTQLTTAEVDYELAHSQEFLQSIVSQPISSFAAPYGDYNEAVNNQIKNYYGIHRTVEEGFNSQDNLDLYRLRVQNMKLVTSFEEFQKWVNKAIADKTWLVLVYHKVSSDNLEEFDTSKADFDQQMAWLQSIGVTVKPLSEAADEVLFQMTPPDVTPPEITLLGQSVLNLTLGDLYVESGATATDDVDGDLTSQIIISGTVDTSVVGTYLLSYNVSDSAGNPATEVVRTVNVSKPIPYNPNPDFTVGGGGISRNVLNIKTELNCRNMTITWVSPLDSLTWLEYGLTNQYTDDYKNTTYSHNHSAILEDLNPGTVYYYRLNTESDDGSQTFGSPNSFTTFSAELCELNNNEQLIEKVLGEKEEVCDASGEDCQGIGKEQTPKVLGAKYIDVVNIEKSLFMDVDMELVRRLAGWMLLQTETNGQAWYLDPLSLARYYLPDGLYAYQALRKFGLGITNADLARIPVGKDSRESMLDTDADDLADLLEGALGTDPTQADTDGDGVNDGEEVLSLLTNPLGSGSLNISEALVNRLKGRILLQVESHGEAWYVNPADGKRYYMSNGQAAYQIMRLLSIGISNADIVHIPVGEF